MSAILLIDDQPISNFITKKVLQNSGVKSRVVDFTDPLEAFKMLNGKHDLILFLDLNMPEMNGWEFLEEMQKQNLSHQTVLLTASTNLEDRERGSTYPCVKGFLTKPLNVKEIQAVLADLIVLQAPSKN